MAAVTRAMLLLTVVSLLSAAAAGQQFTVDVDVQNPEINPSQDQTTRFNISVTNTGDTAETYTIRYNVANPGWYFLPKYTLALDPGETQHSILYADPPAEAVEGNIGVIITVASDGGEVTRRPSYRIVRDRDIIITGFSTDDTVYDPGTAVNVTLDIKNVRQQDLPANQYRAVFTMDGREKRVPIPSLIPSEPETLTSGFMLGQYANGMKTVEARVEQLDGTLQDSVSATVRVRETEKIVRDQARTASLFTTRRSFTVGNEGNTVSDPQTVSTTLPAYLAYFTTFTPEPSSAQQDGLQHRYTWNVGRISPGESVTVRYTVNKWVPALLLLLVLAAAGLAVREYRKPHIVKRVYRKDGTHSVHLRVENRSGSPIDDVVVKDFVPSICSLVEKFDASPPERIRDGGEVTELEWELGRFEPGEERILTYSISPQVQVEGEATLPSAHMEYVARGRHRKRHSHPSRADFR
ncbi:MAG: hypothetical protein ABEI97_01245, partial [Candidatus Nanohaloarchaea archaeon]